MLGDRRPQGELSPAIITEPIARAAENALTGFSPVGVGVDVVDIAEFRHNVQHGGADWPHRVFTPTELDYCAGRAEQLAARFAAKEAVAKALGFGFRIAQPRDIEIVTSPEGAPTVVLASGADQAARQVGIEEVLVSMTREGDCAAAVAVAMHRSIRSEGGKQ